MAQYVKTIARCVLSYLSSPSFKPRSSPSKRRKLQNARQEEEQREWLHMDKIESFEHFKASIGQLKLNQLKLNLVPFM